MEICGSTNRYQIKERGRKTEKENELETEREGRIIVRKEIIKTIKDLSINGFIYIYLSLSISLTWLGLWQGVVRFEAARQRKQTPRANFLLLLPLLVFAYLTRCSCCILALKVTRGKVIQSIHYLAGW